MSAICQDYSVESLRLKECCKCKVEKPLRDFPMSMSARSGYDYKCKQCHRDSWHARKPPAKFEKFSFYDGWQLTSKSIRDILSLGDDGQFRWIVNTNRTRIGDIAGTKEGTRSARLFINRQRYSIPDLLAFWHTGEIPERPELECQNAIYKAERMKDINANKKGFDWSCIWSVEKSRRAAREASAIKWAAMSKDERKQRGRRCFLNRKKRHAENPETKERDIAKINEWKKANSEKARESIRKSIKKRKAENPVFKVQCNLRNRFKDLMRTAKRGGSCSFSTLIGCTTSQLSQWLESQFKRGMNWDNYGTHWHVDHIMPCAAFNHSDPNQVRLCWHWTNLRPLEAVKNMEKSDSITHPQLSLLLSH